MKFLYIFIFFTNTLISLTKEKNENYKFTILVFFPCNLMKKLTINTKILSKL